MENFINVDKNMIVNTTIGDVDVKWYDVRKEPFSIHGLYKPETEPFFHRMPFDVAAATSEAVERLQQESAGGRVRFSTDSPYIAIRAKFRVVGRSSHLTLVSTSGFDLYIDGEFGSRFMKEFRMPYDMTDSYEQIIHLDKGAMRSFTISMPVHAVVESLEVGIKPDSVIEKPNPYRDIKPIIFYGSSIVHGTAASRPGNIYPSIISRDLNVDHINLGFSGNAKGETAITEWMATLPMSIFVCDYDHNAPTVEHLEETHYNMYEIIRKKNPDIPYIMITRPNYWYTRENSDEVMKRRDVVMTSYLKARQTGDKNVWFIDGMSFFSDYRRNEYVLDGVHPQDAGFIRMAEGIGSLIRHILEK